jgi:outer membrane protein assembly factor BamB
MRKLNLIIAALFLMSPFAVADTVIVKDLLYVDSETGNHISAYDKTTLNLRWRINLDSLGIDGPLSISSDKDNIYVGADTTTGGGLVVLSAKTGEVIWSTSLDDPVYSAPTVTKDYLYVGTQSGVWMLDRMTGSLLWVTTVGSVDSSPAVDKGVVYVSTSVSGIDALWTLKADTGEILFSTGLNSN